MHGTRARPLYPHQGTFCHSYIYFPNAAKAAHRRRLGQPFKPYHPCQPETRSTPNYVH